MLSFKRLIEDNYKHEIETQIILLLKENPKKFGLAYYNRSDFKEIELINLVIARIFINDYKPNELELIIQVRMTWLVTDFGNSGDKLEVELKTGDTIEIKQ